jgi:hypothetical protein
MFSALTPAASDDRGIPLRKVETYITYASAIPRLDRPWLGERARGGIVEEIEEVVSGSDGGGQRHARRRG